MDETEIRLRKLELEHDDLLSQREVWHNAQWGVPLAIFGAAIYANWISADWIKNPLSLIAVTVLTWILYIWISDIRQQKDAELDKKRHEIDSLIDEKK